LSDPLHLSGPQDLIVVQDANSDEVLKLARQAEASDPGGGTLEMIDRTVDRLCRDYPTAVPSVLVPRVQQRLRFLVKLLEGKITLGQHRHLLVAGGWLATLLACLQFDLGDDREAAEASQAAAYMFARQAEHQELLAWTYELLAWWALVDRRYHEVIEYSRTGLEIAPNTSAGVQLAVQQAKGWSRLGDAPRADESLRMAGTALSRPEHPEHHFVFDASKLSFYAATCYTWLGDQDMPESRPSRSYTSGWSSLARCAGPYGSPKRGWISAWSPPVRARLMRHASSADRRWLQSGSPAQPWDGSRS
jgi:hypothetical protein